jgi:hypothetical protein
MAESLSWIAGPAGRLGVIVRDGPGGQRMTGVAGSAGGTQDAAAFAPGGGGQPGGSAAGSRRLSRWSTSLSQTFWAVASSASAASSRCLRQMDQISGAYRSTSASQACRSPFLARVTRPVTTGSVRPRLASWVRVGFETMASPGLGPAVIHIGFPVHPPSGSGLPAVAPRRLPVAAVLAGR